MAQVDYHLLIAKALAGEATEEEVRQLANWRTENAGNERLYREFEKLWQAAPAQRVAPPDVEIEWQRLASRLGLHQEGSVLTLPRKSKPAVSSFSGGWLRYTALAASLILIFSLAFYLIWSQTGSNTIFTAAGEQTQVQLPDGSRVQLNYASRLVYPRSFGEERVVELDGEAFFEVQPGEQSFVVRTANARIRVLGTSFNIWAREQETRVIVRSGRVALQPASAGSTAVTLVAGEMASCRGEAELSPVQTVDAERLTGWLEGRIVLQETPLRESIEELRRAYDVQIRLQPASLGDMTLSGSFEKKPLAELLEAICLALGLRYRVEGEVYVIYAESQL